jgi:hypothetical protein
MLKDENLKSHMKQRLKLSSSHKALKFRTRDDEKSKSRMNKTLTVSDNLKQIRERARERGWRLRYDQIKLLRTGEIADAGMGDVGGLVSRDDVVPHAHLSMVDCVLLRNNDDLGLSQ